MTRHRKRARSDVSSTGNSVHSRATGGGAKRERENDRTDGDRENTPIISKSQPPKPVQKASDHFKKFQSMLVRLFSSVRTDELSVAQVEEEANKIDVYSRSEIEAMLNELEFENKIMFRDGVVHQI